MNGKNVRLAGFLRNGNSNGESRRTNKSDNIRQNNSESKLKLVGRGKFTTPKPIAPDFGKRKDDEKQRREVKAKDSTVVEINQSILDDFCHEFQNNKRDTQALYGLLYDELTTLCDILTHYYDPKYNDITGSMNNIIQLMTTRTFTVSMLSIIKELSNDELQENKRNIAVTLSIILDTSKSMMHDDTVSNYVEIFSDYLFPIEIKDMQERFNITEDAALDFTIGIPVFGTNMTNGQMIRYVSNYIELILCHADSMIKVADREMQKKLFYYLFPDINNITMRAVGQCFTKDFIKFDDDDVKAELYKSYGLMLYDIVDEHDIGEITSVLKFVANQLVRRHERNDVDILFDVDDAGSFTNIYKALGNLIKDNDDAAKVFVK